MTLKRHWLKFAGVVTFVAVAAAAADVEAGWHHRQRSYGSSGGCSGGSSSSYGGSSGGSSSSSYSSYGSSGGSSSSYGSCGSHGSYGSTHASRKAMRRAYRHSSHGSSGGSSSSSYVAYYCGSSGGSYGSYGSYGGGSSGGYATSGYSTGYSAAMPIESYRVIDEVPSSTDGEVIGTPPALPATPPADDSTSIPADGGLLVVDVPANADIFVNGTKTSSQGVRRQFLSRGLVAGKTYEFVVRMAVDRDGEVEESTKVVALSAGERSNVSFVEEAAPVVATTSLTLTVPSDAKVWLAGNPTSSAGEVRHFETAGLSAGQVWRNYEIKVTTVIDGREETVSKVIDLAAGDRVELSLDPTAAPAAATASLR